MTKKYLSAAAMVLGFTVIAALAAPLFAPLEQQAQDLQYKFRGSVPADSNVVILYFDNEDIAALGGWPLKRNLYALLIDELDRVGVSAIGIDIVFDERHAEYPEYDQLLAAKALKNGKVVFSSYFRQLVPSTPALGKLPLSEKFCYPAHPGLLYGEQLTLPLVEFQESAAAIGHTNFLEQHPRELPLFVRTNRSTLASFSFELLRLYLGIPREQIRIDDNRVLTGTPDGAGEPTSLAVSTEGQSVVQINFPGPLSSFKAYRSVEVLRAFELQRAGLAPAVDFSSLRNKIVIIGVIAEGRTSFIQSPFTPFFPPVAMHAAAIDNALHHRFILDAPRWSVFLLTILLSLSAVFVTMRFGALRGISSAFGLLLANYILSQLLFVQWSTELQLVQPSVVLFFSVGMAVVAELRQANRKVVALESEKALVESELRARELKLQSLEGELYQQQEQKDRKQEQKLSEEIKKYKDDIRTLTSRVTDLVEFEPAEVEQGSGPAHYEEITYDRAGKMVEVVSLMEKISSSEANVLILGESGTGKELVARGIHNKSSRVGKPFVAINCGAIPETLLESELFGHEKGSFTGAYQDKVGRFEFADGGTIFLDEVAETSEGFQVKLLRVVQQGEFERVGSSTTRKVNVRIIAATNKDIKELLKKKSFREDLYYRINVFTVQIPPLRERKSDIPLLTDYFLKKEGMELSVSSTVMDAFMQYSWPGNVRELESAVKRAAILTRADRRQLIRLKDLSQEVSSTLEGKRDLEEQILELMRDKKFSRNSVSETAQELGGLNRGTVAEYFRGTCLRFFLENSWDFERSVDQLSRSPDGEARERVRKKLGEYLENLVDGVSNEFSLEQLQPSLKPKYKNLPQRYHPVLQEVVKAFLLKKWVLPKDKHLTAQSGPSTQL